MAEAASLLGRILTKIRMFARVTLGREGVRGTRNREEAASRPPEDEEIVAENEIELKKVEEHELKPNPVSEEGGLEPQITVEEGEEKSDGIPSVTSSPSNSSSTSSSTTSTSISSSITFSPPPSSSTPSSSSTTSSTYSPPRRRRKLVLGRGGWRRLGEEGWAGAELRGGEEGEGEEVRGRSAAARGRSLALDSFVTNQEEVVVREEEEMVRSEETAALRSAGEQEMVMAREGKVDLLHFTNLLIITMGVVVFLLLSSVLVATVVCQHRGKDKEGRFPDNR